MAGGLNLYGYAGGDPINFSDPFGLCPDSTAAGIKKCEEEVKEAIKQLLADTVQVCQEAGRIAQSLNQAGQIQFDFRTTDFGYVRAHPDPARAAQGASVPPIFLGPPAFLNMRETKNTIAHEVTHIRVDSSGILRNDRPGGVAYQIGDRCGR